MDCLLPDDILCESCGYRIGGLPITGACPECGELISRSLPDSRIGLPSQNKGGWWATSFTILFEPRTGFRSVRIDPQSGFFYCRRTFLAAAAIVGLGISLASFATTDESLGPIRMSLGDVIVMALLMGGAAFVLTLPVLAVLTAIECWGIRLVGTRRGWRITPAVASTVCDFASVGWLIGSVVFAIGVCASVILLIVVPSSERTAAMFAAVISSGGAGVGLLTFETLVYIGIRQCRFANPPTSHTRSRP